MQIQAVCFPRLPGGSEAGGAGTPSSLQTVLGDMAFRAPWSLGVTDLGAAVWSLSALPAGIRMAAGLTPSLTLSPPLAALSLSSNCITSPNRQNHLLPNGLSRYCRSREWWLQSF